MARHPNKATEFAQVEFATLSWCCAAGLELGRNLVSEAGRGGGKLNALVRRLLLLTWCPFVSLVVKPLSPQTSPRTTKQYVFRHSSAASVAAESRLPNFGFGAHLASEPNLHVLRFHLLFPCYGRIIFLLWACSACTANLSPTDCYANGFSCGTGPETANSPCFLPVIRGYQGESRARSPSPLGLDPSEFASPASWDGAPATREV